MNYTENYEGIRIDVQAVDVTIPEALQERIREMIGRLKRHISEVNWVDVYFKQENEHATDKRTLSIRFGIPGNDAFASDAGESWMALMASVEEKLRRQLMKR